MLISYINLLEGLIFIYGNNDLFKTPIKYLPVNILLLLHINTLYKIQYGKNGN
jgi:hypothetical protein